MPEATPIESPQALLLRLEWTVLKRLDGLLQGDHRTLARGTGLDLADLREYQGGDDVRHIDWNVTARLDAPHVRQFIEDRDLSAWFVLDLTGSVDFGSTTGSTKRSVIEGFTAALARLLTRHGNRVGALFYRGGEVLEVLPPGAGRLQVLQLLTRLRQPAAAPRHGAETRLALPLARAEGLLRRRSMVFVLSDFVSAPGWEAALGRLARRHDLLAVRVFDAMEMELPAEAGLITVQDAETGEQLLVDAQDPAFRQRFEAAVAAHEDQLQAALAQASVDVLELATDDDLLQALLRCTQLRRQRQRLPMPRRAPAELRGVAAVPPTVANVAADAAAA